jgi:hypothetical protein
VADEEREQADRRQANIEQSTHQLLNGIGYRQALAPACFTAGQLQLLTCWDAPCMKTESEGGKAHICQHRSRGQAPSAGQPHAGGMLHTHMHTPEVVGPAFEHGGSRLWWAHRHIGYCIPEPFIIPRQAISSEVTK